MKKERTFTLRIPEDLHKKLLKHQKEFPYFKALNAIILEAIDKFLEKK